MKGRFSGVALAAALAVIAEIVVFVLVGNLIGFGWTILAVILTSMVGAFLLRREGTRAWVRFREAQAAGDRPGPHVSRALVGLLAALLLILPGFLTDLVGLALLVPPVRTLAAGGVTALAARRLSPSVVGDLFGPRRVRVRVGRPDHDSSATPPDTGRAPVASLEGEIVDSR